MTEPWTTISVEDFKIDPTFPYSKPTLICQIGNSDVRLCYEDLLVTPEIVNIFKLLCPSYLSRQEQLFSFCEQMVREHNDVGDVDIKQHLKLVEICINVTRGFDGSKEIFEPIGSVAFEFSLVGLDDNFFARIDRFGPSVMLECIVPYSSNDSSWQWEEMYGNVVDFD